MAILLVNIAFMPVVSAKTSPKAKFGYGSYAKTYGNSKTGGVKIHLSQRDAQAVCELGPGSVSLLTTFLKKIPYAGEIAIAVSLITYFTYWHEQNSNGSLDINVPYKYIDLTLTSSVKMFIGSSWYKYKV